MRPRREERDLPAERMADDAHGPVESLDEREQVDGVLRGRVLAPGRPRRLAVAAQVGSDHVVVRGESLRDVVPAPGVVAPTVQEDEGLGVLVPPGPVRQPQPLRLVKVLDWFGHAAIGSWLLAPGGSGSAGALWEPQRPGRAHNRDWNRCAVTTDHRPLTTNHSGSVWLVGAGPGDPGLITVAGLEALRNADVVLHDALAPAALLREAPAEARRCAASASAPARTARARRR